MFTKRISGGITMETNIFKSVGENIKKALINNNMTQISLAEVLGISKQVLSKIINGQKAINIAEISMISKALNVSVDSLMEVEPQEPVLSPQFNFMGSIKKESTKEKFNMLRTVIDEILFLEEYANGVQ